jgi:hypothetical protein
VTTAILVNTGIVSYAQKITNPVKTNNITHNLVNSNASSVVTEGFEALWSSSTEDAYNIWISHSVPFLKSFLSEGNQLLNYLLKTNLDKCISYSMIDTITLTENTQIVYIESLHKKGIAFWEFTVYKSAGRWLISAIDFNTDATDVIPIMLQRNGKTQ